MDTIIGLVEKIVVSMQKYAVPRIGKVVNNTGDEGSILCLVPSLGWDTNEKGVWCFPSETKSLIIPDVGSYVMIQWIDGNGNFPIYKGLPGHMKDNIPSEYEDNSTDILYQNSNRDIIKYKDGTLTFGMSEILLGSGASSGVARNGDSIQSTIVEDSTFWTWVITVSAVLNGLIPGSITSIPSSLDGKIIQGSEKVKAE